MLSSRRPVVFFAVCATVLLVGLSVILEKVPLHQVELDSVEDTLVRQVDAALDDAVLDKRTERSTDLSAILNRKEPHIETALDVISKPNFAQSISEWAQKAHRKEMESAASPPAAGTVQNLRRMQEKLQRKLDSMLSRKVSSASANVDHVLQTQAKISEQNMAEIRNELHTNHFDTKQVPKFHSAALDAPVRVRSEPQEIAHLQHELSKKIAANERLERRAETSKASQMQKSVHLVSPKSHVSSLAEAAPAPAPAAAPAAAVANESPLAGDDERDWAYESPRGEHAVQYEAEKGYDGIQAADRSLKTARDRVTARLQAQLRNAKDKFERFRSHWSVHMPADLRRATKEGWTSQYSKDYMSQGKTRYDIASEERVIEELKKELEGFVSRQTVAEKKLRDLKDGELSAEETVADLDRHIQRDQRDLNEAETNLEQLQKHLPESYNDLSNSDYENPFRYAHP